MPKPRLKPPLDMLEEQVIETMLAGLKEWRPDLEYPESFSDMQACVRGLLRMFDVKRGQTANNEAEANEVDEWTVRRALIHSVRWQEVMAGLDFMRMAKLPRLRPEDWTQAERVQAIQWAQGQDVPLPKPIRVYLTACVKKEKQR